MNRTLINDFTNLRLWLMSCIEKRHGNRISDESLPLLTFHDPEPGASPYDIFLSQHQLSHSERLILLLALIPHLLPDFFEDTITELFPKGADLPDIGGARGKQHRGMIPTAETAVFLGKGDMMEWRKELIRIFNRHHLFAKENVLYLEQTQDGEPFFSGKILLSREYEHYFITGTLLKPEFNPSFPARLIHTEMTWGDLVLPYFTKNQIDGIKRWISYNRFLEKDKNLARKIPIGFRVLFYGPSGTGKTLTATLLGKEFNKDVYRVDLSQIVSKYIGETEKNLSNIFDKAEHKDWILFFDEADALFGKRTSVQSSHDKYANQETAFLLQRIESFNGLVILASNLKSNIDAAFARRFNTIVHFPMPGYEERIILWEQSLPESIKHRDINFRQVAAEFEISGASIVNVMQYVCLKALSTPAKEFTYEDLMEGIKKEKQKEN